MAKTSNLHDEAGGKRLGAGDPCPFCGGTAGITPDGDAYVCLVCGSPRVLVDAAVPRRGAEKPLLERAKRFRNRRAAWGVGAGVAAAFGGIALVLGAVAALFVHFGPVGFVVFAAFALCPLALSAIGFRYAARAGSEARAALEEARVAVAKDLYRARGGVIRAEELARILRVPADQAEVLLARAQVEGFLDGSEPVEANGRFRIEDSLESPGAAPSDPDDRRRRRTP
jgi:hypothetical protein